MTSKNLDELRAKMGAQKKEPPRTTAEAARELSVAVNKLTDVMGKSFIPVLKASVPIIERFLYALHSERWQRNKARYERRYKRGA